jgi:tetratricopeptide (TPR) repeat protein
LAKQKSPHRGIVDELRKKARPGTGNSEKPKAAGTRRKPAPAAKTKKPGAAVKTAGSKKTGAAAKKSGSTAKKTGPTAKKTGPASRADPAKTAGSSAKKSGPTAKTAGSSAKKSGPGQKPQDEGKSEQTRRANPGEAQKKLELAIQAGKERNYKKAALILEELLSGFEAPPEAYLYLGRSLHALKDYSRALASFNDYVRLRPKSPQGYFFAGRSYLTLGLPHKAVPLLRKARSLNPENTITLAMLGTAYLKSRHSQLAADTFQDAVETAARAELPKNTQARIYHAYINALFIRGIRLCRIDEYELGSQMLDFVLANGGDNPLLRLELGRACREMGQLEDALDHYTQALKHNPSDIRIRWYRASILMALGDNSEALEEIERIKAVDSGLPDLPWNSRLVDLYMIRSFLDTGEWRRSADSCRLWLKQYGPDPLIHAMYAEALRNLKNFNAALNHLERAAELEPKNIELWYERILVAWEAENWKALEKAIRLVKNLDGDQDLIRRFSILLEAKTNADDQHVISLLQNAIRSIGPEPELMYALGERYLKTGLIELALNWFRKAIEVRGDHEKSWLGQIAALEALSAEDLPDKGLLKKAERQALMKETERYAGELRKAYDQYVGLWPDNYAIRRERALYLFRTFEYQAAVKELESLLAWEPSNPSLRRVLAYGYRKTGRYREASVFLKSLLKEKPRNLDILLEYTGCLERAGAPHYAVAVLEKARGLFKKAPELPMALGLLCSKDNNPEKAFDLLREAAAMNKKDPRPYQCMAMLAARKGDKEGAKKYEFEAKKRAKK